MDKAVQVWFRTGTTLKLRSRSANRISGTTLSRTTGWIYPLDTVQLYLSHINAVTNAFVGGWRVNGITTLRSGVPIALTGNANILSEDFGGGTPGFGLGTGIIRPNYTAGCSKSVSGNRSVRAKEWFNTSCFSEPGPFSFGNESRVDSGLRAAGVGEFRFLG